MKEEMKRQQRAAHQIGASAHENHEKWDEGQREDIAYHYGRDSWFELSPAERLEAREAWDKGFADNGRAHGEKK